MILLNRYEKSHCVTEGGEDIKRFQAMVMNHLQAASYN